LEQNIFGTKLEGHDYRKTNAVYAVIFNSSRDLFVTVETVTGHHFLPGGGLEGNESVEECLKRETLEETGYEIVIGPSIGSAMRFFQSTKNEYIVNDGTFYLAELSRKVHDSLEDDHVLKWLSVNKIEKFLVHEHHIRAVKEGLQRKKSDVLASNQWHPLL
jgi:8-oxo-dGTP diphosphatase